MSSRRSTSRPFIRRQPQVTTLLSTLSGEEVGFQQPGEPGRGSPPRGVGALEHAAGKLDCAGEYVDSIATDSIRSVWKSLRSVGETTNWVSRRPWR